MHILIVTHDYPSKGNNYSAYVQARVDLYLRMGHKVTVITRAHQGSPIFSDETNIPALVDNKTLERTIIDFDEAYSIDADIVFTHTPSVGITHLISKKYIGIVPVIVYVHGAEAIKTPRLLWDISVGEWLWRKLMRTEVELLLNSCNAIVTASNWMIGAIQSYFPKLKNDILKIPNPVDSELFSLMKHESTIGISLRGTNKKYGMDLLNNIGRERIEVREPKYSRSELPNILRNFGYFIAPSRMEGQGVMACEAAATGMPILTTKVGAVPEFIFGNNHIIVYPNLNGIRKGIGEMEYRMPISNDEAKDIRDRILSVCGPKVTVNKDIELFKHLIEGMR